MQACVYINLVSVAIFRVSVKILVFDPKKRRLPPLTTSLQLTKNQPYETLMRIYLCFIPVICFQQRYNTNIGHGKPKYVSV